MKQLYDKDDFPSRTLTETDASVIRMLCELGFQQKRIAALYDVNQGRIAEIATGQKFEDAPVLEVK